MEALRKEREERKERKDREKAAVKIQVRLKQREREGGLCARLYLCVYGATGLLF